MEELKNIHIHHNDGDPVDFKSIITSQMAVMIALFQRQHMDALQLTESSKQVEKLTLALIAFTVILAIVGISDLISRFFPT